MAEVWFPAVKSYLNSLQEEIWGQSSNSEKKPYVSWGFSYLSFNLLKEAHAFGRAGFLGSAFETYLSIEGCRKILDVFSFIAVLNT